MSIWFRPYTLSEVKEIVEVGILEHLDIRFTEIGETYCKARMPVDHRTRQPMGILHGGASCVLAESLGSTASGLCIDPSAYISVGLEINANHIRRASQGYVHGICKPVHIGRSSHIWDIRIYDEDERLTCVSRLTNAVLEKIGNTTFST